MNVLDPNLCCYSSIHHAMRVPAVRKIDCGPLGLVPACERCADFYDSMNKESV